MLIVDSATTFTIITIDGAANTVLKGGVGSADTFADVPKYAPEGYIIAVRGEVGTTSDDVFLKFDAASTSTVGAGFGDEGVWREYHDPAASLEFDASTMPHEIIVSGSDLTLQAATWANRLAGNAKTAPTPSFVGKQIKDIGEMQGRLWVLAERSWSTTQTKEFRSFFRKTASALLATDPIDIGPDSEDEVDMQYGVAYDKNLVLFANKSQFLIRGDIALTPSNAAMQRTTKFEMSADARPVVAGQTVMMPYAQAGFSGINEMFPTDDIATNTIEGMTKVVPQYLEGSVIGLHADANARIAFVQTDATHLSTAVFVYNFLWENSSKVQSAWHKWEFPDAVKHMHVADGRIFLWTADGITLRLCEMRPSRPVDTGLSFHCTLDYKVQLPVTANKIQVDRPDYIVVSKGGSEYAAGARVTPTTKVDFGTYWEYTLPTGAGTDVYAGVSILRIVDPVQPVLKDWRGSKDYTSRIVVHKYAIDFADSGDFGVYMQNKHRYPEPEYLDAHLIVERDSFPTADNPLDSFATTITSGTLDVPWGDDQFLSKLRIASTSHHPTTIVEVRWYGQTYSTKRSKILG